MIEIQKEQERKIRCYLVGAPKDDLKELKGLIDTLGMEIAYALTLTRLEVKPAYGMGEGKVQEIVSAAHETEADCIIFDFDLEPTKQRNWEELAGIPVFDRQEVIIRIFAQRAQTKEASLQVELARLIYSKPRLAHMYGDMSRQRGGSYGAKGSGETQLELDQRRIRERIHQVKLELEQVEQERTTQHKKRDRLALPSCVLVGYTNAGKSSLLNALTGAGVLVEDKLFATLDPTTRRVLLKESGTILLTDTVGFIKNLPHTLIDAFKSTLDEASHADLQLLIIDAASADAIPQYETVCTVLDEIGAGKNPRIIILNKTDLLDPAGSDTAQLKEHFPDAVWVSAKTQAGFEELTEQMNTMLLGKKQEFIIPVTAAALLDSIRTNGIILEEQWLDDGIHVTARSSGTTLALISSYLVH
jgi:GTPase